MYRLSQSTWYSSMSLHQSSPNPLHRSGSGLFAIVVCMMGALLVSFGFGYWQTVQAAKRLAKGESQQIEQLVHDSLHKKPPPPSHAQLEQIVQKYQTSGLRYLAIIEENGRIVAEAGTPILKGIAVVPSNESRTYFSKSYVRLISRQLPPPPRPDGPGDIRPPPPPGIEDDLIPMGRPFRARGHHGPPRLVLDIEPLWANQLQRTAQVSLLIGLSMLVAIGALSWMAFRLVRFRDNLIRKLEQERHLSVVGEMSAVLAHEIRNPLTSLKGHAQLLVETLQDNSREQKKAARVVNEAVRLEILTSNLLDFVRAGTIERQKVNPVDVIQEVIESIQTQGTTIEMRTDEAPHVWSLDHHRIKQVWINIIENAIQASPEGGTIVVELRKELGKLIAEVHDQGLGVPANVRELIFEPFQTKKVRGTGLGLAVARRIVLLHGGEIGVRQSPMGGACFWFMIPEGLPWLEY
jgi:two-component system, NtrC family, sensor histidine kinase HydH